MKLTSLTVAASCLLFANSAAADSLFDTTFDKVDGGKVCYIRLYDGKHMRAHPRQTVTAIAVNYEPKNPDGKRNTAAHFELGFAFKLKTSDNWYPGNAYCARHGLGFACSLEGDGGAFRLMPQKGALRLDVVNRGGTGAAEDQIVAEGDDFGSFGKPRGDDLAFVMNRAGLIACDITR